MTLVIKLTMLRPAFLLGKWRTSHQCVYPCFNCQGVSHISGIPRILFSTICNKSLPVSNHVFVEIKINLIYIKLINSVNLFIVLAVSLLDRINEWLALDSGINM